MGFFQLTGIFTVKLFSLEQYDRALSMRMLELTPEYGKGDCYPSACLGHSRLIDSCFNTEDDQVAEELENQTYYVQGWFLTHFTDGSGVNGFPHGFLLNGAAALEGKPCIIDAVFPRYVTIGKPYWLPVQFWTWQQVDQYMEHPSTPKTWPLTSRSYKLDLEERWSYQRIYNQAEEQLLAAC